MRATIVFTSFIILILSSCSENIDLVDTRFFLSESCMVVNFEQDNSIEGTYLTVESCIKSDSIITLELPVDFCIKSSNVENWMIGWGNNVAYYDAGVENIRLISEIDRASGEIQLGELLRGTGLPKVGDRIVFWNQNPSGFINKRVEPIIDPSIWPEFAGSSIGFSSVEYDDHIGKWIMLVNEVDTSKIQIYAAISTDLIHWEAANDGNPILTAENFKDICWAGKDKSGKHKQTPIVSDVIRHNGQWHLFLDGYDSNGNRHIGLATSNHSLLGPFEIMEKPIMSPNNEQSWNSEACFYAKVKRYKDGFVMFYDGRDKDGLERIGMATSSNLTCWTNSIYNPVIDQHAGWRSFSGSTEPNHITIRDDTIFLICAGVKEFQNGFWAHYVTRRMNVDRSGNVSDAQLGLFISTDNGKNFSQHINNPIFTNNYANRYENEHMGGNFERICTDSVDYIFYQAKSSYPTFRYNIMLRERSKN